MDSPNKDPETNDLSKELREDPSTKVAEIENTSGNSSGSTAQDEDNKPKVEITPDSSEQNVEDQDLSVNLANANAATFIKPMLPASENAIKLEEEMDAESSAGDKNDSESMDISSSQDTVVLPLNGNTPKTSEKKPRARASSESAQTPTANKIAKLTPRATRSSQNPDFAAKQRKFLNRVHDPIRNNNSDGENSQSSPVVKASKENKPKSAERKTPVSSDSKKKPEKESTPKRPAESDDEGSGKKKKTKEPTKVVGGVDSYCWMCHRDGVVIRCDCAPCPRVYHVKCVQLDAPPDRPWMCPECCVVTHAENMDTRSRAMRMLSLDQLCNLLRFALNRMKNYEGAEDFAKPVDPVQFPHYRDYIVKPMDLSQLERNLKARLYGSTEAFLSDTKWIVHNSIIFNSVQSKFTNTARALLKLCRQEMKHIDNCPDCYLNSHTRATDSWFTEACRRPHILVWAKLKGFPFWPAKVMSVNSETNQVDVRFFGAHDRAWIPLNQCFLYSKLSPTPATNNKNKRNLEECLQEVEIHIKRLRDKFGHFEHAPFKTLYDPKHEDDQLLLMLPQYESKVAGKRGRLSLHHDGARKSLVRKTSPEKPVPEDTPANTPKQNGISGSESPGKQGDQPMVFIPGKKGTPPVKTPGRATGPKQGEADADRTPSNKQNNTALLKKKTPLTAAAKKCFATEERACFKCHTKVTVGWSVDSAGRSLCTACTLQLPKSQRLHDKICAKCNSHTTTVNEDALCSICSNLGDKPEIHFKKDERGGDPNSTVRGTVTVQRKRPVAGEGDQADEVTTKSSEPAENGADTGQSEIGQNKPESKPAETSGENESPPKFVIQKGPEGNSIEPAKKVSIVDRLQEKLCFTVMEALKDQITPEEVEAIEKEKEIDSSPEKINDLTTPALTSSSSALDSSSAVVVLHDFKNDKEIMEKMRVSEETNAKKKEDETNTPSEVGSEAETDVSSCGDSDIIMAEGSKEKKKKNINNVVQNLKERKSSVDEQNEQIKKPKGHNTLMLDDSVEESSILIIDEGESSDSKKSSGEKSDKSRRKGIPAKVHSRSSTSTESSDEVRSSKSRSVEVLDETSGHFRRSSTEADRPVTITVVTEDDKPQKKAGKEIRSVNISKSLSLSVIKDSSGLEMECLDSDVEEPVIVDSVKKVHPKPTARKTLPNPPRLANLDVRPTTVPPPGLQQPPPLVSLRPPKPSAPARPQVGPAPAPAPRTVLPPVDVPASPRAALGPAHAKLEEVVQKVVTFVRSTFEEMLRASEGAEALREAQAVREAHQLELERLKWQHKQEMAELKHNTDLVVMEIRASMEADKQRALLDLKHKVEIEKEQAISETKRKQWCAYCQKEAQLYCCWNTAYCSYTCQQEHWAPHMNDCRNKQQSAEEVQRAAAYPQMHGPVESVEDPGVPQESTTVVVKKRRRCGQCIGCITEPCGSCYPCLNRAVHAACVYRRCSLITRKSYQKPRPPQHELMPPPSTVPPFRHPGFPPQPRGFHHRNRGPPLFYPQDGFCPQCP